MSFRSIRDGVAVRLSCAPVVIFEVGPCFALAFLLGAFPPLQRLLAPWHGDFVFGFVAGISIPTLIFSRGRQDGWPGVMRAWGLGLFLGSLALNGSQGFLSGFKAGSGMKGGPLASPDANPWQDFVTLFLVSAILGLAFHRLAAHRQEAERQRELADLASKAALRAKLAPHFIFNTLNTLHAQIETDPRGAQTTTERLAALFRSVIAASDQLTISLKEELSFVEAYLGIEQARFGERLKVAVEVPESLETCEVPPLSLQVLVENAVKHGIAPLERGGEIRISAKREGADFIVEVSDPGTGIGTRSGTGTALETLRARLSAPGDLRLARVEDRTVASFRWRQP